VIFTSAFTAWSAATLRLRALRDHAIISMRRMRLRAWRISAAVLARRARKLRV
jgi:hypothetical protein